MIITLCACCGRYISRHFESNPRVVTSHGICKECLAIEERALGLDSDAEPLNAGKDVDYDAVNPSEHLQNYRNQKEGR